MKKKYLFFMVLCSSFLFSLSPTFAETTIVGGTEGEVLTRGLLGTRYSIEAQNFVIHVKDVPNMDILSLSKAQLTQSSEGEASGNLQVLSSSVEAKAGVYGAVIALEEEPSIQTTISIFVVDDSTVQDGRKVIYGHDFQMKQGEKQGLTETQAKRLGAVRAYDIPSGVEETEKVSVNKKQLTTYIENKNYAPLPLDWSLSSTDGRVVTKRIYAKTIREGKAVDKVHPPKASKSFGASGGKKGFLPSTGVKEMMFLVLLGLFLMGGSVFLIILLKRKKEEDEEHSDEA